MDRANPADLRQAIEAAQSMLKAGLLFVPMPVLNDEDYANLVEQLKDRLAEIEQNVVKKEVGDE